MFSRLRLLLVAPKILQALQEIAGDVYIEKVWVSNNIKTVHVSLEYNNKRYDTWGADSNEALALAKSLMEMVERLHADKVPAGWPASDSLVQQYLSTTSGCAAHLDYNSAASASRLELIERHQMLRAFLLSESPMLSTDSHFIWKSVNQTFVSLAYKKLVEGGYVFGSGAASTIDMANEKASHEISGITAWSKNKRNLEHLKSSTQENGPSKIQAYHLQLESLPSFLYRSDIQQDSSVDIQTNSVELLEPFREIPGLVVVRSFSNYLQPFSFLPHSEMRLNPLALPINKVNPELVFNVVA